MTEDPLWELVEPTEPAHKGGRQVRTGDREEFTVIYLGGPERVKAGHIWNGTARPFDHLFYEGAALDDTARIAGWRATVPHRRPVRYGGTFLGVFADRVDALDAVRLAHLDRINEQ